jgi:hypothetical protein
MHIPQISNWKEAVDQWNNGSPTKGLFVPLKRWTKKMKAGRSSVYSQRKLIVDEYNRLEKVR